MAKSTVLKIKSVAEGKTEIVTEKGKSFFVYSFEPRAGFLKIRENIGSMTVYELADVIAGLFDDNSLFANVNRVYFTFNTVTVIVGKEAANNPKLIVNRWQMAFDSPSSIRTDREILFT